MNTALSNQDFLVVLRQIYPNPDPAVLNTESIVQAHAVFLLVQGGRPNDALRVARFLGLQAMVDYAIANGADPEAPQIGETVRLETRVGNSIFAIRLETRVGNSIFAIAWDFTEA